MTKKELFYLEPGDTVYHVTTTKMGNTTLTTKSSFPILIKEINHEKGEILACYNFNQPRKFWEHQWKKWRTKKPFFIRRGIQSSLPTKEEVHKHELEFGIPLQNLSTTSLPTSQKDYEKANTVQAQNVPKAKEILKEALSPDRLLLQNNKSAFTTILLSKGVDIQDYEGKPRLWKLQLLEGGALFLLTGKTGTAIELSLPTGKLEDSQASKLKTILKTLERKLLLAKQREESLSK